MRGYDKRTPRQVQTITSRTSPRGDQCAGSSEPTEVDMAASKKGAAKKGAAKVEADPNANPDNAPAVTARAARKIPMFVDSTVHLAGDDDKGGKATVIEIKGGVLLDELEEQLTDDQIDELIALKAIRPATASEVAAADARAALDEED